MDKVEGVVERITYQNEESGYGVIKIRANGFSELLTLTGKFVEMNIGTVIEANGDFVVNKKFGKQFCVKEYRESLPASIYGIEKYLGSGLIEGIGPKFAKQIVSKFGKDTINIIENDPMKLLTIPKMGEKRTRSIINSWKRHKNIKNLMIFLSDCSVSTSLAHKIYKVYGEESTKKLRENPYGIVDDIYGVGFKTADLIAKKLGISTESYDRCRAGIFHILNQFSKDGHCYTSLEDLVNKSAKLLGIPEHIVVMTFSHLRDIKELICEDKDKIIYLPPFYHSEIGAARRIYEISLASKSGNNIDFEKILEIIQKTCDIKYDETQISAIKTALSSKFSVITGGPGVGKTTITKAIISIFELMGKEIVLAAPTGRAAKRMAETCEIPASTIHRLLEGDRKGKFGKNEENKLEGDVIIIDECSMIDVILMYNLLKAIPNEMTVILIGDSDQLPSVGAGNVLNDIINSKVVPVIKLSKIYRQAESSKIITNSHKINLGQIPDLSNKNSSDFFFINNENPEDIVSKIKELCSKRLPKTYKIDPAADIQLLSPMKRGLLGTENLNAELQSVLNDNPLFIKRGTNKYKLGDKVMQIKNNYDKNIFNGDIGFIKHIDLDENTIEVDFDGNLVEYSYQELDELVLSYAITIHKSQGGEFPIVIIPVHFQSIMMLQRNLIYTGVTRAKRILILIGSPRALRYAIKNNVSQNRRTLLKEKLVNKFNT